ncbi:hypothetical protein ABFX02_14G121500 [Erythranthe guttata]
MGRAKLNMELISKEKSRNVTFKKRKEGLIRKMHEFATLCDVSACMIIYAPPKQPNAAADADDQVPEIWPENTDQVRRIIDIYKSKKKDSGNKTFGLPDFFHDRKRKIDDELAKMRKKNREANYPTSADNLNLNEAGLREFGARLSVRAQYVKSRIELLRRDKDGLIGMGLINNHHPHPHYPIEANIPVFNPNINHHHQELHCVSDNSMMNLLMNDDDDDRYLQFGNPPPYQRQFFPGGGGMMEPILFYGPAAGVYPGMAAPPQMQFPKMENYDGGQEDFIQYQMNPRSRYY